MTLTLFVAATVSVAVLLSCANGEGIQLSVEEPGIQYSNLEGYRKGEVSFHSLVGDELFSVPASFEYEPCMAGVYNNIYAFHGAIRTPRQETSYLIMHRDINMFGMWIDNLHGEMNVVFRRSRIEVQKFTSKDILGLLDDRYHNPDSKKNKPVFNGFINFFCPNESCMFNKIKIVAISDGIVTDHHTVGLLDKRLKEKKIKKTLRVRDKRLKKTTIESNEDEKDNEKEI